MTTAYEIFVRNHEMQRELQKKIDATNKMLDEMLVDTHKLLTRKLPPPARIAAAKAFNARYGL